MRLILGASSHMNNNLATDQRQGRTGNKGVILRSKLCLACHIINRITETQGSFVPCQISHQSKGLQDLPYKVATTSSWSTELLITKVKHAGRQLAVCLISMATPPQQSTKHGVVWTLQTWNSREHCCFPQSLLHNPAIPPIQCQSLKLRASLCPRGQSLVLVPLLNYVLSCS